MQITISLDCDRSQAEPVLALLEDSGLHEKIAAVGGGRIAVVSVDRQDTEIPPKATTREP